jgi:hypothetical protein
VSASIKVTRSVEIPLDELQLPTKEMMQEIGLLMRERIVRRTMQGIGPDDQAFEPLSPGYAERKQRELGTSRPDLTVSGNMLNDLTIVDVGEDFVTLGWNQ